MILHLKDWGVQRARRHELLAGKPALARGAFGAIFEGTRPDRVLKLTLDRMHYCYMTDYCAPQGVHKPVLHQDLEAIGETSTGQDIFLIEVERLQPLERKSESSRVIRRLMRKFCLGGHREVPDDLTAVKGYFQSLAAFMGQLNWFAQNYECRIDGKVGQNYMQRADGTLVASDPVYDHKLMARYRRPDYLC